MRPLTTAPQKWEIKYETHEEEFLFTFLGDGKGTCHDIVNDATVPFSWNPDDAPGQDGPEFTSYLKELAEELFWSEINEQLGEDAVISDSEWAEDFGDRDVEFVAGSRQELANLTRLILHSFPSIWSDDAEQRTITFFAQGENSGESAGLGEDANDLDFGSEPTTADRACLVELLNFAIGQNTPVGEELEYNDGPSNRRSGYSWYAKSIDVEVSRPSFHEMAEARSRLRQELKFSLSTTDLERLLPFE